MIGRVDPSELLQIKTRTQPSKFNFLGQGLAVKVPGAFSRRGLGPVIAPTTNLYDSISIKKRTEESTASHISAHRRASIASQNTTTTSRPLQIQFQENEMLTKSPLKPSKGRSDGIVVGTSSYMMGNTSDRIEEDLSACSQAREKGSKANISKTKKKICHHQFLSARDTKKRFDEVEKKFQRAFILKERYQEALDRATDAMKEVDARLVEKEKEQHQMLEVIKWLSDRLLRGRTRSIGLKESRLDEDHGFEVHTGSPPPPLHQSLPRKPMMQVEPDRPPPLPPHVSMNYPENAAQYFLS